MFAEGGTTNSKYLLPFKRGPFMSLKAMTPLILKYGHGMFCPAYDIIPFFSLIIFQLSYGIYTSSLVSLPPFMPNDYLFETHKDKGHEKWEIYAWAVRELISQHGQLPKNDQPYREKLEYELSMYPPSKPSKSNKVVPPEKEPLLDKEGPEHNFENKA